MREISKLLAITAVSVMVTYAAFASDYSASSEIGQNLEVQQKAISGTVTDSKTGQSIIGVNILIQGTSIGTVTDVEANFRFKFLISIRNLYFLTWVTRNSLLFSLFQMPELN